MVDVTPYITTVVLSANTIKSNIKFSDFFHHDKQEIIRREHFY